MRGAWIHMAIEPYWRKHLDAGYRKKHADRHQSLRNSKQGRRNAKKAAQRKAKVAHEAPALLPSQKTLDQVRFVVTVREPGQPWMYLSPSGITANPAAAERFDDEEAQNLVSDNRSAHPECAFQAVRLGK